MTYLKPACKGINCGATDGVSHSRECQAEHEATMLGAFQAAAELRRLQAEVDHRINLYGELSDALGCDAMDSHAGRVGIAAKLRKDAARYRHMRSNAAFQDRNGPGLYWYLPRFNRDLPIGERLDAAIDAAKEKP